MPLDSHLDNPGGGLSQDLTARDTTTCCSMSNRFYALDIIEKYLGWWGTQSAGLARKIANGSTVLRQYFSQESLFHARTLADSFTKQCFKEGSNIYLFGELKTTHEVVDHRCLVMSDSTHWSSSYGHAKRGKLRPPHCRDPHRREQRELGSSEEMKTNTTRNMR